MSARSADRDTFYRVDDTYEPPIGERIDGIFTRWRMPDGKVVMSLRRDVYEGALEAANAVLRRIVENQEYLSRSDEKPAL